MDFAIIQTGGKQYKVSTGDTIIIEKLSDLNKKGDEVVFDQVLLVNKGSDTKIGTPFVSGAKVGGVVDSVGKGRKVVVVKFKQKSRNFKTNGHRQPFTKVTIKSI
jgi:large subunit ribosomal protein L21